MKAASQSKVPHVSVSVGVKWIFDPKACQLPVPDAGLIIFDGGVLRLRPVRAGQKVMLKATAEAVDTLEVPSYRAIVNA